MLVINKEKNWWRQSAYNLWAITYEPPFGKIEGKFNCVKISKEITPIKENWDKIIKDFKVALSSHYPATEVHNNSYITELPSLIKNYKNVTKRKLKITPQTNPDDYLKPYDLVKVNRKGSAYQHAAIYLGNGKVAHVNNPQGKSSSQAREDTWENFLNGESKIKIYHPFIPFKRPELIREQIETAIKAEYGKGKYHLLKDNCEHFATMCVYGLGMSKQKIYTVNSVTGKADYLLQAIEASNETFRKLKTELGKQEIGQQTATQILYNPPQGGS